MNQVVTRGIILNRTNYGEADRIITLLTPDHGKVRLMARGVRKAKSKLAGGIELFSVSDITFIRGKGEIGTLTSSRLVRHYGKIVGAIDRVQLGYDLIKMLDRATEDHPEKEYFELLDQAFQALNNRDIDIGLIRIWFEAQLLHLAGHSPNLDTDVAGQKLVAGGVYDFDLDAMAFAVRPEGRSGGRFTADHIKLLRLVFRGHRPHELAKIQGLERLSQALTPLIDSMFGLFVRV